MHKVLYKIEMHEQAVLPGKDEIQPSELLTKVVFPVL